MTNIYTDINLGGLVRFGLENKVIGLSPTEPHPVKLLDYFRVPRKLIKNVCFHPIGWLYPQSACLWANRANFVPR